MGEYRWFENGVRIRLDEKYIEFLHDNRIYSAALTKTSRWIPGGFLCFLKSTEMEQYASVYNGEFMNAMGSFSFMTAPIAGAYRMQFSLGRYCSIGGGLRIVGNAHPITAISSSPILYDAKVTWVEDYMKDEAITDFPYIIRHPAKGVPKVGHDVWFGADITLNQNVKIGNGAIVGTNSHVTRDVPDYAIFGGNPARLIRYRFPEEIVKELVDIEMWNDSPKDLARFDMTNIETFISEFNNAKKSLTPWIPKKTNLWQGFCDVHGEVNRLP